MSEEFREPTAPEGQKLDVSVKVFPVQDGKNLLANASVTIGGCFAIRGVRVMNGEKGVFVSMPQRKNAEGEYRDICFPTTAEMRKTLNRAVLGEYHRTMERSYSAEENRKSVLETIKQVSAEAKPPTPGMEMPVDKGAR